MHWLQDSLTRLAVLVRQGDKRAAQRLQKDYGPPLEWLVRRSLRRGDVASRLGQDAHREARLLAAETGQPMTSEPVVRQVISRLWAVILDDLQARRRLTRKDTWTEPSRSGPEAMPPSLRQTVAC